jgi:hypothetical protein
MYSQDTQGSCGAVTIRLLLLEVAKGIVVYLNLSSTEKESIFGYISSAKRSLRQLLRRHGERAYSYSKSCVKPKSILRPSQR